MAAKTNKIEKITSKNRKLSQAYVLKLVYSVDGRKMLALRSILKLNRDIFARILSISPRSIATIESGKKPSEAISRRIKEIYRIVDALSEVISQNAIGEWITTPNDAFDGLKPFEVIERGEADRIWQMIFLLRSGVPG